MFELVLVQSLTQSLSIDISMALKATKNWARVEDGRVTWSAKAMIESLGLSQTIPPQPS